VVGVSGGPDSLALLLGLFAINLRRDRRERPFGIVAAHVHHHLRPSADDDLTHVQSVCQRLSVPCEVKHVEPHGLPGNVSANARRLRYAALQQVADEHGAAWIATAHHAEDQLETMIMALCRGTGPEGFAGMPMMRDDGQNARLIRPLLRLPKRDCLSMCEAAGMSWRTDPTNADARRVRARLRRDVMPVLDELWPGAAERTAATAQFLHQAHEMMEARVQEVFGDRTVGAWTRSSLRAERELILTTGLRRAALTMRPGIADALGLVHVQGAATAIRSANQRPQRFIWPGQLRLEINAREVRLLHGDALKGSRNE